MPFKEGELVVFADEQGRFYLQRLRQGGAFHTCWGLVRHEEVFGLEPGCRVSTTGRKVFMVFYPTAKDYVMNMPRKSGIIYPKDTGAILVWADLFPGARVLCGGVGSGALVLAVLRQVGPLGLVVGYDVREDMLAFAAENIKGYYGESPHNLVLKQGDVYGPLPEREFDRALLDVPEPWRALDTLREVLRPGGIVCAYLPSINQADAFHKALRQSRSFGLVETLEVLVREWHLEGRSVRPKHRMVGHTGFLTFARRLDRRQEDGSPGQLAYPFQEGHREAPENGGERQ